MPLSYPFAHKRPSCKTLQLLAGPWCPEEAWPFLVPVCNLARTPSSLLDQDPIPQLHAPPTRMLLTGMWINLTRYPTKPMIRTAIQEVSQQPFSPCRYITAWPSLEVFLDTLWDSFRVLYGPLLRCRPGKGMCGITYSRHQLLGRSVGAFVSLSLQQSGMPGAHLEELLLVGLLAPLHELHAILDELLGRLKPF